MLSAVHFDKDLFSDLKFDTHAMGDAFKPALSRIL